MREIDDALLDAAYKGDVDGVRRALQTGARVNARIWPSNHTALGVAAAVGHSAVVREVLAAGAKIDIRDDLGRTPLHLAAGEGKVETARALVEAGADIEALTHAGETPLIEAARYGHLEVVRALIDAGAEVGRAVNGTTAYDHAIERKKPEVAELLRAHGGGTASTGARELARAIASALGGRARRERHSVEGLPDAHFVVKVTHRQVPMELWVFDGGCVVAGRAERRVVPFALNRPFARMATRVAAVRGLPVPVFRVPEQPAKNVIAFFRSDRSRELCAGLGLSGDEMLAAAADWFHLVHRGSDLELLRKRLDLLAELFPPAPPVRLVSETAHRITIGRAAGDGGGHRWGGELRPPVVCRNCKAPAHLLLTIDATDPALGARSLGMDTVRVVFCLDCLSFPNLTYLDQSKAHPRIIRQDAAERFAETSALPARAVRLAPMRSPTGAGSKIGGAPKWIQGREVPDCIKCLEPMAFLAQIASTRTLSFVDDGTLYTFVCERCMVTASLVQSH